MVPSYAKILCDQDILALDRALKIANIRCKLLKSLKIFFSNVYDLFNDCDLCGGAI